MSGRHTIAAVLLAAGLALAAADGGARGPSPAAELSDGGSAARGGAAPDAAASAVDGHSAPPEASATASDAGPRPSDADAPPPDAGAAPPTARPSLRRNPLARKVDEARVQRVLATLDLRARVGQLVMAYPQIRTTEPVEVGGVLYVGNTLQNLPRARERIANAVAHARIPPFVAVDMEGGPSNRMKRAPGLRDIPPAREMAQLDDAEVRAWGKKVGEAMRAVGLNMNLAPVLDVAETGHMARNQRSFSGDPRVVSAKARAYSEGLLGVGVVPIGKHFPGYGDLEADSDHALATADWPRAKVLEQTRAFDDAASSLAGVMLSNLVYSAYGPRPAILSPPLVSLAHQHEWLAVTDDIAIKALADAIGGSSEDVLKAALMAGNDILLTTAPPDWDKGLDYLGLLSAFAQENPNARLQVDVSCRRVLRLKDRMGLLDGL